MHLTDCPPLEAEACIAALIPRDSSHADTSAAKAAKVQLTGNTLVDLRQVRLQSWATGPLAQVHNGSASPYLHCRGLSGAEPLCRRLQEGGCVLRAHCL